MPVMYKLIDVMKRKRVKVNDLALGIEKSKGTITGYRNGTIDPPYSVLQDIAEYLGCSICDIVEDK